MAVYIYGITTVKYADAASSNYAPGSLSDLPNTVKGTVTLDETEGSTTKFEVDQQYTPIRNIKTEEGELSSVMQFYDMTFATLAALKGGTGNVSGYVPATGYTTIEKFLEITTDAGYKFLMYNAAIQTRIMGGLSRDKMLSIELKATPQLTADNAGSWKIDKVWP